MPKRTRKPLKAVAKMYVDILEDNGFEIDSQFGSSVRMKKKYFPGYSGTLTADVTDTYSGDHVYISFDGIGVKKSRQMDYNDQDEKKLVARIKRVVKEADVVADRLETRQNKKVELSERVAHAIGMAGLVVKEGSISVVPYTTCEATVIVNGYRIQTNTNLIVNATTFGIRQEISLETAIKMAELLPEKVEEDE